MAFPKRDNRWEASVAGPTRARAKQLPQPDVASAVPPAPEHFGFILAHELTQPLTAVATAARAGVRLLRQNQVDREELIDALNQAAMRAEQAACLIASLRELARGRAPGRSWIELRSLLDECLGNGIDQFNLGQVDFAIPADLPKLWADRVQLGLVFLNIVENALQAMGDLPVSARRLWIRAVSAAGFVTIEIGDAGPGLSPGQAQRMFEPLHTSKPQGMGLGLALCRWIVEAHEGTLTASQSPHEGAVFHITLPLGRDNHENEKPSPKRRSGG